MRKIIRRELKIDIKHRHSAFLWGPRKTGKSTFIRKNFPSDQIELLDLLDTDTFGEYAARPGLLKERFQDTKKWIVVDEVQKIPILLDQVHWLIENKKIPFLLTGSSARKLRRGHANLLAGRARRKEMLPLTYQETEGFDLERVMHTGLLPPHFLSDDIVADLRSYVADYLKEEIAEEAKVRNLPSYSQFMKIAALSSGSLINYTNFSQDTGVSQKVVRNYFQVLEDTLLGYRIQPWRKSPNRRMIVTEKFYMFDIGVANYLMNRQPRIGSPEFGYSFEHYIFMELRAYQAYKNPELEISFWRSAAGQEVDFILGEKELAIEVKAVSMVPDRALRNLWALSEDGPVKKSVVVCLEKVVRKINNIEILPWQEFLKRLWAGEFV